MAQEQLDGGSGRGGNVVNIVLTYGHPQIFSKEKKKMNIQKAMAVEKLVPISSPEVHATKQARSEKPKLKEPGEVDSMLITHKKSLQTSLLSLLALWEPG